MRKSYRILCLALCLMLTCSVAFASEYTMPEKMSRQISAGSGVKGAVMLAVAGSSEWLDLLVPFTGSTLQLRYIEKDGQFQLQIYAVNDQEEQRALTQIYGDDANLYLRSELLPDTLLSLPLGSGLMDAIFGGGAENPTFYSVVQELLSVPSETWETDWAPALAPYEAALETWLTQFALGPSITQSDSGASNMTLRYAIPAEALKGAMKDLMGQVLQDNTLLDLLRPMLSEAQQAVYLNPAIAYFYDAVVDQLPLSDELSMTRVLSTRGEMLSSELVMPLPENAGGWASLSLNTTAKETALTLSGAAQSVTVALEETAAANDATSWNGFFRYLPAAGTPISAAFTLAKQFTTSVDEADNRGHETTSWSLTAQPDLSHLEADDPAREDYADFDRITVELTTHYSGRDQFSNPTTLEMTLAAQLPAVTLDAAMSLRTTTPWVLTPLSTDGAEPMLGLTGERVQELLAELSRNAALTMTSLTTLPAATDEPAAVEPTLVPPAQ